MILITKNTTPRNTDNTFNCKYKLFCKGICTHVRIGYSTVKEFSSRYIDKIEKKTLTTSETHLLSGLSNFLEEKSENLFKLEKDLILNYFLETAEFERKYCSLFNQSKVEKEIQKLPDEIKIVSRDEIYKDSMYLGALSSKPSDVEFSNPEKALLINIEVDNDIPIEDVLRISDALSIINFSMDLSLKVKDSNIRIYNNYYSQRYVLLKATEKNLEIEDNTPGIVTRKEDLFYYEDANYRIYFQIVEAMDPISVEYYKLLKNI